MSTDPTDPTDPRPDDGDRADAPRERGAPDRTGRPPAGGDEPTAVHPGADPGGSGAPAGPRPGGSAPGPDPVVGLTRSSSDRMLFGVCGGLGVRYGFEPLVVRLAFVATLFLGGAGVLFYLAAAVLIPADTAEPGAAPRTGGPAATAAGGALRVLVGLAVAIAAFFALCAIAAVSFGTTAFLGAWPAAIALLILAGLLIASARSRRTTGTLLLLGLVLAVPATAAVLGDVEIDRSVGERSLRPGSVATAERGYRLGTGQMIVDLRDLPLRRGDRVRVPARVDVGQLGVVLPRDRCVAWTIRTDVGVAGATEVLGGDVGDRSWLGGEASRTVDVDPPRDADDRRPRVTLDLRVGVGHGIVSHSRAAIDGQGPAGRGVLARTDDVVRTSACRDEDRGARRG